jgi:hypothetical protein
MHACDRSSPVRWLAAGIEASFLEYLGCRDAWVYWDTATCVGARRHVRDRPAQTPFACVVRIASRRVATRCPRFFLLPSSSILQAHLKIGCLTSSTERSTGSPRPRPRPLQHSPGAESWFVDRVDFDGPCPRRAARPATPHARPLSGVTRAMAPDPSGDVEIYGRRIPRAEREALLASLHTMMGRFETVLAAEGAGAAAREAECMTASRGSHSSTFSSTSTLFVGNARWPGDKNGSG